MKLLFILRHPVAVRSLHGVFRLLDRRGHEVHLAYGAAKSGDAHRVLQRLSEECPRLTFDRLPRRRGPGSSDRALGWSRLTEEIRLSADGLRYLDPRYDPAEGLRARGLAKAPPAARRLGRTASLAGPTGVAALGAAVRWVERSLPTPPHAMRFVAEHAPDVVVATHLNEWGSPQSDYVRAAKRLGIRTAYLVFSWDNLTNKGLVRDVPDRVLVWNELQKAEAVELQHLPAARVRLTGAPAYDHWFEWRPSRSRADFCNEVGLDPERPYVLYVCSAKFVAPDEAPFVRRWIDTLRAHGGLLADAGILVRPHPRNAGAWRDWDPGDAQVRVWPRAGEEPVDDESRQHYFDSIHHSAAVVGINTSAQIEAAIVDRPVHTVLADEFRVTQQGTLHFHYLQAAEFGHLHVATTLEEHAAQLEESLRGRDDGLNERFLLTFVRPFGLDVPAAPRVVEELEQTASLPARVERDPVAAPIVRAGLAPFAARAARRFAGDSRERAPSLARELRLHLRSLVQTGDGAPVVAGPWTEDETGELLYWLPFLSWAEATTAGLRGRLVVVARESSLPSYAGIGSSRVPAGGNPPEGRLLDPALVARRRGELAAEHPGFMRRLAKFARPAVPDDARIDLPDDDYVAVRGPVRLGGPVVSLDGLDRGGESAALARSRGYVGPFGASAFLAVLLGVPAVAIVRGELESGERGDLRVAEEFLPPPTFGRLRLVGPDEAERAAAELLGAAVAARA